jgi:hypothetical protein
MKRQQPSRDHRGGHNYRAKPVPGFTLDRFVRLNVFRSLDAFWGQLECPCQNQSDGKANHDDEHNEPHRPIWNFEKWKDLRRDLDEQPCDDCVSDGDFVNVAPLQLSEEFLRSSLQAICKPFPTQVRKGAFENLDHSGLGPRQDRFSDAQWKRFHRQEP